MAIKVAIVGLGNCASALVQGVWKYSPTSPDYEANAPGLMRDLIGGYAPQDIQFVCAFDVDERKVDLPIAQAI